MMMMMIIIISDDQWHPLNTNIIDLSRDRIHSVGRRGDENLVNSGTTKDSQGHVDALIASHSQEKRGWR
jgi:hypothetical protein